MADALPGHNFARFISSYDDDNVFSNFNVDKSSDKGYIEGVYLIGAGATSLENKIFKIMLLNNNQYFAKDSGAEFRA